MDLRKTHLIFKTEVGQQKPENLIDTATPCPFCQPGNLVDIIERRGKIVLLKNKYQVLQDAYQTVLLETDECNSELSMYTKDHLYDVIRFGFEKWQEMKLSGDFKSVIFYKNHGPFSGGTIRHPHMQLVGLYNIDCQAQITADCFEGILIDKIKGVQFNFSTKPLVGFSEFNVIVDDIDQIDRMADYVQVAVHYVLNHLHRRCNSYNMFFYQFDSQVIAKIMPRFVTSPLFIGYAIPHLTNRCEQIARDIQERYFNKK